MAIRGSGEVGVVGLGSTGVRGESTSSGDGVRGQASSGEGVYGTSSSGDGVSGRSSSSIGVRGFSSGNTGVGGRGASGSNDFFAFGPGKDYGSTSSVRWKSDIRPIDDPLRMVAALRGVYFNWDAEHGGHHDVGMIAEEVGQVLPEVVSYEEDSEYAIGMDYSRLTPLLVEAVKMLKVQSEEKESEISELKERLSMLETLLKAKGII